MTLVAKKKPPVAVAKKRHGMHHRRSKKYYKPYWPYLPMVGILAAGVVVNNSWAVASAATINSRQSRVQALTGIHADWLPIVIAVLAAAALLLFVARHTLVFHKVVVRGEKFVNNHPLLDVTAVFVFTFGFVLTR